MSPVWLQKLTEDFVSSNAKIKTLGVKQVASKNEGWINEDN